MGVLAANTAGQERPVFCAGADLKAINSGQAGSLGTERGGFAGFVYRERTKPVIVALDEALALASQITACAPLAVWESRTIVLAAASEDDDTLKRMTNEAFGRIMGSDDTKEGLKAFIEKRTPNWQGR